MRRSRRAPQLGVPVAVHVEVDAAAGDEERCRQSLAGGLEVAQANHDPVAVAGDVAPEQPAVAIGHAVHELAWPCRLEPRLNVRGGRHNHKHRDGTDGLPAHIRT